ncbi:hypothetical protein Barb7_01592 [Bacteroidales bacterium Barb7]|nr:hypothetical protein Barb7_01592 [Bacteroidales bacterium Barb7]
MLAVIGKILATYHGDAYRGILIDSECGFAYDYPLQCYLTCINFRFGKPRSMVSLRIGALPGQAI